MRFRSCSILFTVLAGACENGSVVSFESGPISRYVVNQLQVPTDNAQGRAYGLDLNGDGTVDNQLGSVMLTLSGMGFPIQESNDAAVAEGTIILLVDLVGVSERRGVGAFGELQLFFGTNPMPPACDPGETYTCTTSMPPVCTGCQHHLTGSGVFDIDSSSPQNAALVGVVSNDVFDAGPGTFAVELALADTQPIRLDLVGGRARVALDASGSPTGAMTLAGAITQNDLVNEFLPALQRALIPIIQRDCCGAPTSPGGAICNPNPTGPKANCGCLDGSTGKTLLGLFDTNPKDCTVSVQEIQANSLIESLLAPDITIGGQMALSLGVQASVVSATF